MNSFTEKMLNSPYVVAKLQEDHNLISLNFSRKAFQKNIWNAATIHARGLFVDATTGDVKMRSYNKFFYIDTDMRTISISLMQFLIPTILLVLLLTHSSHKQSYSL